jgi:thiamine kinase-like enzyme
MNSTSLDNEKDEDVADIARLNDFLLRHGLANSGDSPKWTPLAGGVSSDIWRVDLQERTICVKRARSRLKVEAEWHAPRSRNRSEWEWLSFVARRFPEIVPRPLAHDEELQALAIDYLEPENYLVWKNLLLNRAADPEFAGMVGLAVAGIHAESAGRDEVREIFNTDDNFLSLRIEPYLLATAQRHTDIAPAILKTAERTMATRTALVHGDVSPKNILVHERQPIFLDAECAWYGDPAFDLAFCLTHFLLKCVAIPSSIMDFIACFVSFSDGYLNSVNWESRAGLEERAAQLLPILFLARVDGKSPVEYLVEERDKNLVRAIARGFILCPATKLIHIADHCRTVIKSRSCIHYC